MNKPLCETDDSMLYHDTVVRIIRQTLQLDDKYPMGVDTPLLGAIPELDSMSVVTILTGLEDDLGFYVEDDDVTAETFETVGTLLKFVQDKAQQG